MVRHSSSKETLLLPPHPVRGKYIFFSTTWCATRVQKKPCSCHPTPFVENIYFSAPHGAPLEFKRNLAPATPPRSWKIYIFQHHMVRHSSSKETLLLPPHPV